MPPLLDGHDVACWGTRQPLTPVFQICWRNVPLDAPEEEIVRSRGTCRTDRLPWRVTVVYGSRCPEQGGGA